VVVAKAAQTKAGAGVLMLVENLSVPLDRRVWQESLTLRDAGLRVVVVCPRGRDRDAEAYEVRDGIEIHRYDLPTSNGGVVGYLREYVSAYRSLARLSRELAARERFDVVHAANPPDFLLLAARGLRRAGTRFVFDHHDLAPELYESRYGRRGLLGRLLLLVERLAFRQADVVIATNESYRRIAVERGGKRPEDVFVVRNGPDLARFRPQPPDPAWRRGAEHLIAYVGMMGVQDGVDNALRALHVLRARRDGWRAVFAGDGDRRPELERLSAELGLGDCIEFTGLIPQDDVIRLLATADVCLAPEPSSPLNDKSTMVKVAEYMAMARPIAAHALPETRATAGDAAVYAECETPEGLAAAIDTLLEDGALRDALGAEGRARVEEQLAWKHSAQALLAAYERVLGARRQPLPGTTARQVGAA
jgi:glycosyltransferase involved in cell wall biosynthesis